MAFFVPSIILDFTDIFALSCAATLSPCLNPLIPHTNSVSYRSFSEQEDSAKTTLLLT